MGKIETLGLNRALSPIEHFIIGSSVSYHGLLISGQEFSRRLARHEDIEGDIFLPLAITADKVSPDIVRNSRAEGILAGVMACFTVDSQMTLSEQGFNPALRLSDIDPKTGYVIPTWRLLLQNEADNSLVDDPKMVRKLTLGGALVSHLRLETPSEQTFLSFRYEI